MAGRPQARPTAQGARPFFQEISVVAGVEEVNCLERACLFLLILVAIVACALTTLVIVFTIIRL
jgi:hypothetical protein